MDIENIISCEDISKSSFNVIAGYENVKTELFNYSKILKNLDEIKKSGYRMPNGILLAGKPGIGKTVLANALIKESNIYTVSVDVDEVEDDDLNTYLKSKFDEAKEHSPSIIFIDELDKICGSSSKMLLSEESSYDLDKSRKFLRAFQDLNSANVIFVCTINDLNMLPDSLKRSGRFDRIIKLNLPNSCDRKKIFLHYLSDKKFDENLNIDHFVDVTNSMSGADIETIINEAGINALINGKTYLTDSDLDFSINNLLFKTIKEEVNSDVYDKNVTSIHECGHLMAAIALSANSVSNVSLYKYGDSLGHFSVTSKENLNTLSDALNNITISLAGREAEKIFFPDEVYLSSSSDISNALDIVQSLLSDEFAYGLEYSILRIGHFTALLSPASIERLENKKLEILNQCQEKAKNIILENMDFMKEISKILVEKNYLNREEIFEIYEKYSKNN